MPAKRAGPKMNAGSSEVKVEDVTDVNTYNRITQNYPGAPDDGILSYVRVSRH